MVDPQIVYLTSQLPSVISSTVNLTKIPDTCITLNRMSHEIFSITCDLHAMKICSVSHKTGSESREIESRTEISGPGYCSNAYTKKENRKTKQKKADRKRIDALEMWIWRRVEEDGEHQVDREDNE